MIRPPFPLPARLLFASLAMAATAAVPFAALAQSGTFNLPTATPTPSPAPAGPADERAGIAIPPRSVPAPRIEPAPVLTPEASPLPVPQTLPSPRATERPAPATAASPAPEPSPTQTVRPQDAAPPAIATDAPLATPTAVPEPLSNAGQSSGAPLPTPPDSRIDDIGAGTLFSRWWPFAAGALGALMLLGAGAVLWRRRKSRPLRLAAPVAATGEDDAPAFAPDLPRLDLTLDITGATRSVMMFTLTYRLTIANRSDRAVNDLSVAVQLACARASAGNAASPGAAQALAQVERVGPHQARTVTGQVQLPLSAIQPLRQGSAPLFVPLVHVTLEGDSQRAMNKSFVIGTPSASGTGRVHPILLDQPPGGIAGLVAQAIAIPPVSPVA